MKLKCESSLRGTRYEYLNLVDTDMGTQHFQKNRYEDTFDYLIFFKCLSSNNRLPFCIHRFQQPQMDFFFFRK